MKPIFFLLIYLAALLARGQNSFEFTYGTDEDELLVSAIEDFSNNVVMVGRIGNRNPYDYDPLILKVYPNGNYITKRLVRADTNGFFQTINLLQDSSYLLTGVYSDTSGVGYDHFWVCKMDTNMNVVFEKSYLFADGNIYSAFGVVYSLVDNENNIIVVGVKNYEQFTDMLLIKLNQQGDTLLTRTHHFQFGQRITDISCIPGSNDYLGIAGLIGLSSNNYGPVRFDSVFNILDIKHFPIHIKNKGTTGHWLNDTHYLYSCLSIEDQERRIMVYNIDTSMNFSNELLLDKPDTSDYPAWRTSMAYANDSTIYVSGFVHTLAFYPTIPNAVELYLIDTGLNLLGYKEFGWDANYDVWGMVATSDDGCMLVGNRRTEDNTTESDVHIIKALREDFEITTDVVELAPDNILAKAWPNPATDYLFIELNNVGSNEFHFQIFNLEGKLFTSRNMSNTGNVLKVNIQTLTKGYYIYRITTGKHVLTGKFFKR
ncbi:MAG: T9SS type A sorting domain-containing protein [Proteobacteria bacterium]|nr:T9SS type A sorting domain-containing protein [Pseudomonadota bacterium]